MNHEDWQASVPEYKGPGNDHGTQEDEEFLNVLRSELLSAHKQQCQTARAAVGELCADIVRDSSIPFLDDHDTPCSSSEPHEEAQLQSRVLQEFTRAVERLQSDHIHSKRRGNLPKECVSYLKTWCNEHIDNPYPSDLEKMEMSRRTRVDVNQISHWFINYRKRVWRPSLPADHPAFSGRIKKEAQR